MDNWKDAAVYIGNQLGVAATFTIYASMLNGAANASIAQQSLSDGSFSIFTPYTGGAGASASMYTVPALATPCDYLIFGITPASDPSSGSITIRITRRT